VTEHRAVPASEHGGHPPPFIAEVTVSDGIDAAMNAMEPAGLEPKGDAAREKAGVQQLAPRDQAVLVGGHAGYRLIGSGDVAFRPHGRRKATADRFLP
jgi:hypothetical protein